MKKPARVLIVACELASLQVRDGASAAVLSNGIGEAPDAKPVYELLGWDHRTVPETDKDIGFDIHPNGWKVVLTPRVPVLASTSTPPLFSSLIPRIPELVSEGKPLGPTEFDWVVHPGGLKVLMTVEKIMGISPAQLRASYDVYKKHGNCSAATIFSVFNRLRQKDMGPGKEHVVGLAFGPGVAVEMCVFRRPGVRAEVIESL
ncbi:hypothetical protein NM688_g7821 [Phlebia brevispora]|uniref:Uncharacterized protein n=1 Tax=Phlebia brevispora TaxID=194682 RepID=A0ACC1S0S5_9APHY|nr:hypothetical protein NM688_g7821 [Phlebia brevispora]